MVEFELTTGDFVDRLTIARLKHAKGKLSSEQLKKFEYSFNHLESSVVMKPEVHTELLRFVEDLTAVNEKLWEVEDMIRDNLNDYQVISLARAVIEINDNRARFKRDLDILFGDEYDAKVYAGSQGYDI